MILSSADLKRILGGNQIIRLSATVEIVERKPALSGREGLFIYIKRYPELGEFEATFTLWVESDGSEPDDIVIAELKKLLPKTQVTPGLMTKVTTTEFRSESTLEAPVAAPVTQVDTSALDARFEALAEDIQDQMLLIHSGRDGKDGAAGRDGADGRDGRDMVATEADLEDLQNVEQNIAKKDGQVLTWKDGVWQNLFIPQVVSSISSKGGVQVQSDWSETDTESKAYILNKPFVPTDLGDLADVSVPTPQEGQALVWNEATQLWEPADVSNGSLIANGEWRFSTQTTGTPSAGYVFLNNADPALVTEVYIHEINNNGKDVGVFLQQLISSGDQLYIQDSRNSDNAALYAVTAAPVDNGAFKTVLVTHQASQGAIAGNKICGVSIIGGSAAGTVSVLDDLLDVDTTTTTPQLGDVLKWNGSQWVPDATAGTGIEEAPADGNYYVRQNGTWVNLATALTQITTPDINVDGADFTQQVTTAQNSIIYDAGDFTGGGSAATDNAFLDGEVFAPAFDDTVIDGGNASV